MMIKKALYLIALNISTGLMAMESASTSSNIQNLDQKALFSSVGYESEYSIFYAIKNGDVQKVREFLKENPNAIFTRDEMGRMPLEVAFNEGQQDVVDLLLIHSELITSKLEKKEEVKKTPKSPKGKKVKRSIDSDKSGKLEVGFPINNNNPYLSEKEQAKIDFDCSLEKIKSRSGNEKINAIIDNFSAYKLLKKIDPNFSKIWDDVEDSSNNNLSIQQQPVPNLNVFINLHQEVKAFISKKNVKTVYQKRILELLSDEDFNELNNYLLKRLTELDPSLEINGEPKVELVLNLKDLIEFLILMEKLDSKVTDTYGENILSRTEKSEYSFLKKLVRENYYKSKPLIEKAMAFSKKNWGKILVASIFLIDGYRQASRYNYSLIWRNPSTGRFEDNYFPSGISFLNIKNAFFERLYQFTSWATGRN